MTQRGLWANNVIQDNRRVVIRDYGIISNIWYLFPQGGGPRGSFTTFAALAPNLRSRDTIFLSGVLREQAVAPDGIFDVAIIGAANKPRQATSGGTPTGGGATWMAPASGAAAATALLRLVRQGWSIEGISFTPHTSSPAIELSRSASVDLIDSSHTTITNCLFSGQGGTGQIGIQDANGSGQHEISNNRFSLLASAILGIATGAAVPLAWHIADNIFHQNTNDIKMSLSRAVIERNRFLTAGSGATNKVVSTDALTGGVGNFIIDNQFNNTEAEIAPGNGFTGVATDVWRNFVTDGTWYAIGQPA